MHRLFHTKNDCNAIVQLQIWTDIVDVADAAYASRAISGTELMQTIVTNFPFHSTGSPKFVSSY